MEEKIAKLLAQLTVEEKAALSIGANQWQTVAIDRVGLPAITVSDGPHGLRRIADPEALLHESLPATAFPTASALAATWNVELVHALGEALAEECVAQEVDILLGPGNNMKRTPLCGRNFEYFAEDPFLGGELAAAYINGLQSKGVGASLKHFVANNQEQQRFVVDARIDERALRELYLAGFERAVKQSQPWTVMCAYNRLNGPYCSQHARLLTKILREEWGFEGFVVSDWGAVYDRVAALVAGLDLEMPGPQSRRVQEVIAAVEKGTLDEAALDESVARLLRVILRAQETPKGQGNFDVEAHHALARRIAGEAIVLLKNEGALLPLEAQGSVAVIGEAAQRPYIMGGGSSRVNPTRVEIPFEVLQAQVEGVEFRYAMGYRYEGGLDEGLLDEAITAAREADVTLIYVSPNPGTESEGYDRTRIELPQEQVALIQAVAAVQPHTVVVAHNGSAIAMSAWIDGVPAVLEAGMMGQAGAGAIADVLFGKMNPSGKLAETYPLRLEDTPAHTNYPGEHNTVRYGEGLFIGYRYYDEVQRGVLFPFGHGLSYTTFAYGEVQLSATDFRDEEGLRVSVDVTNTGDRAGKEIVQLYVHDVESRLRRPYKELKGFAKVALEPGETRTVTFHLDARAFAYYDPAHGAWIRESGTFEILVGSSSAEIHARATARMESTQTLPCVLTEWNTVEEWLADECGAPLLHPLLEAIRGQIQRQFGADAERITERVWQHIQDRPLMSLPAFFGEHVSLEEQAVVVELLEQIRAVREG